MKTRIAVAGLAAAALVAAGCGSSSTSSSTSATAAKAPNPNAKEVSPNGDIPDNQAYVPYSAPGTTVSVKVPEGWSRSSNGAATTFTDKLNSITIEQRTAPGAASVTQVKQADIPALAKSVKGFKLESVAKLQRKSGPVVRVRYLAAAKVNPVTGKGGTDAVERYLFTKSGKLLVLTLSGPKGADNVDPWKIVTDSVTWR
ncbi:MAG: hypothetical protein QOJ46_1012 [bacterium]